MKYFFAPITRRKTQTHNLCPLDVSSIFLRPPQFFQKEVMHFDPHRYPAPCTFHEAEGLFDPRGHSSMAWRPGPGWETRARLNSVS